MAKKLTLSMDEAVIEAAKEYVGKQGISLSSYIESLLKKTTGATSEKKEENNSSPTPHMDAIRELRKKMKSPEEQEKYLEDLYKRKPHMKEWFEMRDKKYGY